MSQLSRLDIRRRILDVGPRVRALRLARGLTQHGLGAMVDMSQGQISSVEIGRAPRIETVARIAEALGVSMDYITLGRGHDGGTDD